jgi:Family of unknown function (DUF5709)
MAQRDYEEQPEAPDLGASVQLESDQHLAAPPGDRDGLDAGYAPADRPYALDEDGVTARGMREGDSLDDRLRRERGDEPSDPDRAGRLEVAGGGAALETPDDMDATDVGIDGGAASAEEAAVHVSTDPAARVETEPSVAGSPALDDPELDAATGADERAEDAMVDAARDLDAEGESVDPGAVPAAEGAEPARSGAGRAGGDAAGGDVTGRGPDPALPGDPNDPDPAEREIGDAAAGIDASRRSDGAVAPASGRQDAGPEVWR